MSEPQLPDALATPPGSEARVRATARVGEPQVLDEPATPPGSEVRVRATARVPVQPHLVPDDESLRYVEGRPGVRLAEDLAEQRSKELPTGKQARRSQDGRRRIMPLWQEIPLLVIVSFCIAVLVRSFLVQAFMIPSESMEDTLLVGDRVLVNKVVYETRDPRRGEVVVFRGTDRWAPESRDAAPGGLLDRIGDTLGDLVGVSRPGEKDFVKRVIGVPGDRVFCCDGQGRVMVNGVGIDEPYLKSNNPLDGMRPGCGARRFEEVVVPPGELFVMGDNRAMSQDSRCQGTVPIENVVGRAFARVWPPSRWGAIDVPDVFSAVPEPSAPSRPLPGSLRAGTYEPLPGSLRAGTYEPLPGSLRAGTYEPFPGSLRAGTYKPLPVPDPLSAVLALAALRLKPRSRSHSAPRTAARAPYAACVNQYRGAGGDQNRWLG